MKKFLYGLLVISLIFFLTACGSSSSTTQSTDTSSSSNQNSIVGDWNFQNSDPNVRLELDLENNNEFNLDYQATTANSTVESDFEGTYEANNDTITLSIIEVEQVAPEHSGKVIENGQIALKYKLSDDGKQLTLSNSDSSIQFLPKELTGTRETD